MTNSPIDAAVERLNKELYYLIKPIINKENVKKEEIIAVKDNIKQFLISELTRMQQETAEEMITKIDNWLKDMCPVTDNKKHNKAFLQLLNYILNLKSRISRGKGDI